MFEITSLRYNKSQIKLENYSLIKVEGDDRESFFQGQVTNDLSKIKFRQGEITARLNRPGKLQSYFFLAKLDNCLLLLCPKNLEESIINDFSKFIIMDQVSLTSLNLDLWLKFNDFNDKIEDLSFDFIYCGLNARLAFSHDPQFKMADLEELEKIRILNGWPKWQQDIDTSLFINDSYLNEIAISYKKGCFLGQETAAKIENNRGAAYYPVLLKINPPIDLSPFLKNDYYINSPEEKKKAGKLFYQIDNLLQVTLFRDLRVIGKELDLIFGDDLKIKAEVVKLPFYLNQTPAEIASELYHQGIEQFQKNKIEESLSYLKKSLEFNFKFNDAYESLGVIYGRSEKYLEAIYWMDQLLKIHPQSVMAHTNKSLYLMKLGRIEEAEAEKSLATVKSFGTFKDEAILKKQMAEEQKKQEADLIRREKMFLQVLEIDSDDVVALYGMASIHYDRKIFPEAIINLKKVLDLNSRYSNAYLLLGKCFEEIFDLKNSEAIYQQGIEIASTQGEMMPANFMQARLNQIKERCL